MIRLVFLFGVVVLAACNSSSSSSSSSSSPSDGFGQFAGETFTTDSATVLGDSVMGPRDVNPECVPDDTFAQILPRGLLVFKPGEEPTRLVVFAHGFGHTVQGSWKPHMLREIAIAQSFENQPGSVAFVATDYRDNFGFPTLWGAHDTITATLHALERFPTIETVYLFGVSMGGAISGTAIVESANVINNLPNFDPSGFPALSDFALFDYWIDVEGVSQLAETWGEATAAATISPIAAAAQAGIERDAGGTLVECPLAYQRRSPAQHAGEMNLGGIRAATVVHAVNDGLVPYNQGREMAGALATALIPTQFFTITRTTFEHQDPGTTGTGALGAGDTDSETNLAGHASEADAVHPVMRVAFENLRKMLDGTYNETIPYFECVIDPDLPEETCPVDQFQP